MNEKKQCTSCNEDKPITEFGFRKARNRYRSRCKKCESKAVMAGRTPETYKATHDAFIEKSPNYGADSWMNAPEGETRMCKKCGEVKPVTPDHWQRDAHSKWGLRPSGCKECLRKRLCASCGQKKLTSTMTYIKHCGHICSDCLDRIL